ncbi:MAG: hypothetical protein AB9834_09575 [Lentimicrobium sp.]
MNLLNANQPVHIVKNAYKFEASVDIKSDNRYIYALFTGYAPSFRHSPDIFIADPANQYDMDLFLV